MQRGPNRGQLQHLLPPDRHEPSRAGLHNGSSPQRELQAQEGRREQTPHHALSPLLPTKAAEALLGVGAVATSREPLGSAPQAAGVLLRAVPPRSGEARAQQPAQAGPGGAREGPGQVFGAVVLSPHPGLWAEQLKH